MKSRDEKSRGMKSGGAGAPVLRRHCAMAQSRVLLAAARRSSEERPRIEPIRGRSRKRSSDKMSC